MIVRSVLPIYRIWPDMFARMGCLVGALAAGLDETRAESFRPGSRFVVIFGLGKFGVGHNSVAAIP